MKFNTKEGIDFVKSRKEKIRELITRKIDDLPVETRLLAKRCILTGGCTTSIFYDEEPNDLDLLFLFDRDLNSIYNKSTNSVSENVYDYIPERCIARIYNDYMGTAKYDKAITSWAVTCKNGIQFVMKTAEYRKDFDFVHCMPYYDITRNKFFISELQFDSILNKELIVNPRKNINDVDEKRFKKYFDRGWSYDGYTKELHRIT